MTYDSALGARHRTCDGDCNPGTVRESWIAMCAYEYYISPIVISGASRMCCVLS